MAQMRFTVGESGSKPKKKGTGGTPQSRMSNTQLQSRGPGYGSQAARTAPPKATTAQGIASGSAGNMPTNPLTTNPASAGLGVTPAIGGNPTGGNIASAMAPAALNAPANYSYNPSGSGWNSGTTDPMTGYLAQFGYTPQGAMGLYDNPVPLAADVLGTRGVTNPGMAGQLAELFDMFQASQFVNNRGGDATDNDTLNYIANAMQQAVTPGGQSVDPYYMMQTILNQSGTEANPLSAFLGGEGLTPEQQIDRVNRLMANSLPGMNPYAQQAYGGALRNQSQQYMTNMAKGNPGGTSYFDYLQGTPFAQWVR